MILSKTFQLTTVTLLALLTMLQSTEAQQKIDVPFRMSPFQKFADTYDGKIITNYRELPLVSDTKKINALNVGTTENALLLAKNKINSILSECNPTHKGTQSIELHGPITIDRKSTYFWIVQGKVNSYWNGRIGWAYHGSRDSKAPKNGRNNEFCCIFTYTNTKADFEYILIDDQIFSNVGYNYESILKYAETNRATNAKRLHDEALARTEWTVNGKPISGKIEEYTSRNGFVKIGTKTFNVLFFAPDDQDLIKGYIDHKNIPVRINN